MCYIFVMWMYLYTVTVWYLNNSMFFLVFSLIFILFFIIIIHSFSLHHFFPLSPSLIFLTNFYHFFLVFFFYFPHQTFDFFNKNHQYYVCLLYNFLFFISPLKPFLYYVCMSVFFISILHWSLSFPVCFLETSVKLVCHSLFFFSHFISVYFFFLPSSFVFILIFC